LIDPFPTSEILDKLSDIGGCIPLLSENGMESLKDLGKDFDKFSDEMAVNLYIAFTQK